MADPIEQREDGTILFPTRNLGSSVTAGICYLKLKINCFALGLDPNSTYTVKLASILRYEADGTQVNNSIFRNIQASATTNSQGDFNTVLSFTPSGFGLPPIEESVQMINGQVLLNSNPPFQFLSPNSDEANYFNAQGGVFLDQETLEYAIRSNFIFIVFIELKDSIFNLIKTVQVPVAIKLLYMLERDYVLDASIQVDQDFTCDLDTPINDLQSPSAINTTVTKAVVPFNKTTEREVIHLDNRIKST
jgi:hypothetical protein